MEAGVIQMMQHLLEVLNNHQATIYLSLFLISELLAQIPAVKANGVFQMIFGFLAKKQLPPKA